MNFNVDSNIHEITWRHCPHAVEIFGEISDSKLRKFRDQLRKAFIVFQEIPILINSEGGDCYALLGMIDAIRSEKLIHPKKKVITMVLGKAFSAAAALFCCGDERYISPHGTIMIHNVQVYGCGGSVKSIACEAHEASRLDDTMVNLIKSTSTQKDGRWLEELIHKKGGDAYLDAIQAVQYGIATDIATVSWDINVTYDIKKTIFFSDQIESKKKRKRGGCGDVTF